MRILAVAAIALILSACANLDGIYALKGKKSADAIAYLGLPSSEVNAAGKKILVWDRRGDISTSSYTNSSGQTFVNADVLHCIVKIALDTNDIVELVEIEGNARNYCNKR